MMLLKEDLSATSHHQETCHIEEQTEDRLLFLNGSQETVPVSESMFIKHRMIGPL